MSKVMVLGGWQHLLMLLHSIVVFFGFNRPGLKVGWYMLLVGLVVGWPIRKQIPCFCTGTLLACHVTVLAISDKRRT
jgi:hypothetical protein